MLFFKLLQAKKDLTKNTNKKTPKKLTPKKKKTYTTSMTGKKRRILTPRKKPQDSTEEKRDENEKNDTESEYSLGFELSIDDGQVLMTVHFLM